MILELALLFVFPAAMAMAAAMDLLTMTIPNRISLALVAGFLVLAPLTGLGLTEMAVHLGIGLAMLVVGLLLFIPGWIGGGDAKLFAAVSLWVGLDQLLAYAVYASLLGGALTLGFLALRMVPVPFGLTRYDWLARLHDSSNGIPYGIALALAGLLVYPQTVWMSGLGN
ncbi:MAG: prepilin peptidase [Hyphomicrobiales bacterium]|nr:prepilin peptidase [Hyphomicrobiales bacterium]